jgi:hypothetical protein
MLRSTGVFVRLFVAADPFEVWDHETLIIEAQFLAESPIVYFDGGRRFEERGYEQIKGAIARCD